MAGVSRWLILIISLLCLVTPLGSLAASETTSPFAGTRQRLLLGDAAGQLPWFFHESPQARNVSRALIVIHGHPRDLGRSLSAGMAAIQAEGLLDTTVVVAPLFPVAASAAARCRSSDTPEAAPDDALWTCASWIDGGLAEGGKPGSFEAMDRLLAELPRHWPGLQQITLAGFSAGAQFVQHYIGFAHPPADIALRYVVADPGSWLYFDDLRPKPVRDGKAVDWRECRAASGSGACRFDWIVSADCSDALRWKFGLQSLPENLAAARDEVRARYAAADVVYVEGERDTGEGRGSYYGILDKSCAAQAQGPYRLQRGLAYAAYDREFLRPVRPRPLAIVPGCAHDVSCVLPSAAARTLLFPAAAQFVR